VRALAVGSPTGGVGMTTSVVTRSVDDDENHSTPDWITSALDWIASGQGTRSQSTWRPGPPMRCVGCAAARATTW